MDQNEKKYLMKKLDWVTTIVPFVCVLIPVSYTHLTLPTIA